jgi:hypothetical protein
MTPKEKAKELIDFMLYNNGDEYHHCWDYVAKNCALIAVNEIILANPHSNPFNTNVYLTIDYWIEVKKEIQENYTPSLSDEEINESNQDDYENFNGNKLI